jgi:hypothetical protein
MGDTFMHPYDLLSTTARLLDDITLEEANLAAKRVCEHLSHMDAAQGIEPCAVIACAPLFDRAGEPFAVTAEEVQEVLREALGESGEVLGPLEDTIVPTTLISAAALQDKVREHQPRFVEGSQHLHQYPHQQRGVINGGGGGGSVSDEVSSNSYLETIKNAESSGVSELGIVQRELNNGIKLNLKSMDSEPHKISMRLFIPGMPVYKYVQYCI